MLFKKLLILLISAAPAMAFSQPTKGKSFTYRLTTESFRNNQPDSRSVAVSWHSIIEEQGHLAEQVRWMTKTVYKKNDTLKLDSIAQQVRPYTVFMGSAEGLKLPPLLVPDMTGEITDLHTFYVAVSPSLHSQRLNKKLPFFYDSVLHGQFADGVQILKGDDQIQVAQKLVKKDKKHTVIETSFTPPSTLAIQPLLDTIGKQTFSTPNNFQMVRKGAGDKVNLLWGVEEFIITSTIDNKTGQLLEATMINTLNLRMRYNASADLAQYDAEMPVHIKRIVKLELLK
jgi:hypothetical protein